MAKHSLLGLHCSATRKLKTQRFCRILWPSEVIALAYETSMYKRWVEPCHVRILTVC
jgi:hypothetical protein